MDLVKVDTTDQRIALTYGPRNSGYMVDHQRGTDRLPARPWFTLAKSAVRARVVTMARAMLDARTRIFNRGP